MPSKKKGERETDDAWKLIETDRTEFAERFPALFREITDDDLVEKAQLRIDEVRVSSSEEETGKRASAERNVTPLSGYEPGIVDFIQRASTLAEAEEIIDFLEKRKEVLAESAEELRRRLHAEGLESFGPRRKPGHYERTYLWEAQKELMVRTPIRQLEDEVVDTEDQQDEGEESRLGKRRVVRDARNTNSDIDEEEMD
jgi:hypothetical protein